MSTICKKKTILLVEDEAVIGMHESLVLEKQGFDVVTAHTAEKAIEIVEDEWIDLILMDIDLGRGRMTGTEAAERILRSHNLPIVFLTGHTEKEMVEKVKNLTRYGYVLKNSGEFMLIEAVTMALELFNAHRKTNESEAKYRAAFMTSPNAVNINAMDGLYVDINEGFTTLTGYTREDVIGKLSSEIRIWSIPEDREKLIRGLEAHGEVEDLESVFRCKDGSFKTAIMSARVIKINNEPHILSITRDITRSRQMDEQMEKSNSRFESIFNESGMAILLGNYAGCITDVNLAMTEISGYAQEELIGNHMSFLFLDEELQQNPLRHETIAKGETVRSERMINTRNGELVPVLMNTRRMENNGLQAVFYDISYQRELEQSLVKSRKKTEETQKSSQLSTNLSFFLTPDYTITEDDLETMIGMEKLQNLTEDFHTLTSLGMAIADMNENIIVSSGRRDICPSEKDNALTRNLKKGEYLKYKCAGNLWDIASPLMIQDMRVGTQYLGQFFYDDEEVDIDFFEKQAEALGRDKEKYLAAVNGVPRLTREKVNDIMHFHSTLVSIISDLSCRNTQLYHLHNEQKRKKETLKESNLEKDYLLKELNHRVKNNLSMISSLISLKNATSPESADLADLKRQIDTIQLIHEKLHQTGDTANIELYDYVRDLLKSVFSSFAMQPVRVNCDIKYLSLPVKTAISLGLLINEIATNAIKHGFVKDKEARFTVELDQDEANRQYELKLANTGNPFPAEVDLANPETFGLRLVSALVAQLEGTLELKREPQTMFRIRFPMKFE